MFSFWAQEQAKKVATSDMWPENTFRSWEASLKVDWQSCEYLEPIQRVHSFWGLYKNMTQFTQVDQAACSLISSHFGGHLPHWWSSSFRSRKQSDMMMTFFMPTTTPPPQSLRTKNLHRKMSHKVSWAWRIFPQDTTISRFRLDYRCVTMVFSQSSPSLLYVIIPAACKVSN